MRRREYASHARSKLASLWHDQADVAADGTDQKFSSQALSSRWKLRPGLAGFHLQAERGRLDGLLLVTDEATEAVGEGVCGAEFHPSDFEKLWRVSAADQLRMFRDHDRLLFAPRPLQVWILGCACPPGDVRVPRWRFFGQGVQPRIANVSGGNDRGAVNASARADVLPELPQVMARLRAVTENRRLDRVRPR